VFEGGLRLAANSALSAARSGKSVAKDTADGSVFKKSRTSTYKIYYPHNVTALISSGWRGSKLNPNKTAAYACSVYTKAALLDLKIEEIRAVTL
jgi:hypothetical protein